ncbi:uncharacterized protein TNCV_283631 [Trichonephila clavipes]|uniref:Uncharacterized protein n=1 Tax=Trichonephila clavipes TaxID=2585209 RepID=A0A8X6VMQ1_TRICX|nr:uncharacterized protein TNCV_283631 [Trichonephila clavipes]
MQKTGFQMLNDDDPVNDETDEDEDNINNESSKCPSNSDAFSALETAMEWYEQQSEYCPTQLLLLKRIRGLAGKNEGVQWVSQDYWGTLKGDRESLKDSDLHSNPWSESVEHVVWSA